MSETDKETVLADGEKSPILPKYYKAEMSDGKSTPLYRKKSYRKTAIICILLLVLLAMVAVGVALGVYFGLKSDKKDSFSLPAKIKINEMKKWLEDLQSTVVDNSRSVLNGYNNSAEFIQEMLRDFGYDPTVQHFEVPVPIDEEATFRVTANIGSGQPLDIVFPQYHQFQVMLYSAGCLVDESNDCQWRLVSLLDDEASGYGCDTFNVDAGSAVLIPYETDKGNCSVYEKAINAEEAGAEAIIFVSGNPNATSPPRTRVFQREDDGTVSYVDIVSIGVSYATGNQILELMNNEQNTATTVTLEVSAEVVIATTFNVFAETRFGREDRTVMIGAHLDSVPPGPGINDDGSGSILNLQLAAILAQEDRVPRNKVRFAWWGAEELGLLGSRYYVSSLSEEAKRNISVYLNFDMVGSPNYIRGVYSAESAEDEEMMDRLLEIQNSFTEYFDEIERKWELVPFTGGSDYRPFLDAGIPAGGLFTGAGDIKTEEQWEKFGGIRNVALDPCYHQFCDTVNNIDYDVYEEMTKAAGYTLQKFMDEEDDEWSKRMKLVGRVPRTPSYTEMNNNVCNS